MNPTTDERFPDADEFLTRVVTRAYAEDNNLPIDDIFSVTYNNPNALGEYADWVAVCVPRWWEE